MQTILITVLNKIKLPSPWIVLYTPQYHGSLERPFLKLMEPWDWVSVIRIEEVVEIYKLPNIWIDSLFEILTVS